MEYFFLGFAILIGLGALVAYSGLSDIKGKFASLGVLQGKLKDEILAVVGPPSSVSAMNDGKSLLQWQHISEAGGYHIALLFDHEDICEGITHESSS